MVKHKHSNTRCRLSQAWSMAKSWWYSRQIVYEAAAFCSWRALLEPASACLALRRNLASSPFNGRDRWRTGLWIPFLCAFLVWLWAVWFLDLAISI